MYQSGILWHFGFDCHYPDSFPGCYPDGKWKCFVLLVWSAGSVNCYQSRYDSRRYDITYASSMGRAASPIAGVIIAISEIAGVSATDLAKRNIIPLTITLIVMIVIHFFI